MRGNSTQRFGHRTRRSTKTVCSGALQIASAVPGLMGSISAGSMPDSERNTPVSHSSTFGSSPVPRAADLTLHRTGSAHRSQCTFTGPGAPRLREAEQPGLPGQPRPAERPGVAHEARQSPDRAPLPVQARQHLRLQRRGHVRGNAHGGALRD